MYCSNIMTQALNAAWNSCRNLDAPAWHNCISATFGQCVMENLACSNLPPPDTIYIGSGELASSGSAVIGSLDLTPQVVDSVMSAFNIGYHAGVLSFMPAVGGALAIIIIAHLFTYAVSKV